jgi:hypothetical protein
MQLPLFWDSYHSSLNGTHSGGNDGYTWWNVTFCSQTNFGPLPPLEQYSLHTNILYKFLSVHIHQYIYESIYLLSIIYRLSII